MLVGNQLFAEDICSHRVSEIVVAGGNAIRGSRVGAGPMGEAERGESAPRRRISFWCANGHETRPSFASDAVDPRVVGLPALRPAGRPRPRCAANRSAH